MAKEKLPLPRFEIFSVHHSVSGKRFYVRFLGKNGKIIWRTSEDYNRRAGATNAIMCIAKGQVNIVDLTKGKEPEITRLTIKC